MFNYREYKRHDVDLPPCRKCGNDNQNELSAHHVFPQGHNWRNDLREKAISLCRPDAGNHCHRKLHQQIDRLERQHGGKLPADQYPLIALAFIT